MCNLLFELWCREKYINELVQFAFVNGDGGDGGVEAYGVLANENIIAIQSKWFPNRVEASQIQQITDSFQTALRIRPNITNYIVCIPRDLSSKKIVKAGKIANNTDGDENGNNCFKLQNFASRCKNNSLGRNNVATTINRAKCTRYL